MLARLIAVSGPLKGAIFPLHQAEFIIGRDASNALCLDDPTVSRQQCIIARHQGEFHIRDLASRNGTLLNHATVTETTLSSGDQLQVGNSVFVFLSGEGTASLGALGPDEATQTLALGSDQSVYLQPRGGPNESRSERDLRALLHISRELGTFHDAGSAETRLVELVQEAVECRSATFVPLSEARLESMAEQQAISGSSSVLENGRILAVPLTAGGLTLGLLRLEAGEQPFDELHLEFVSAVGAIGSLALANAAHVEYLEAENKQLSRESRLDHEIEGASSAIAEVLRIVSRAAAADSTVLIQGESGTGKELVARAIHKNSARRAKPFIAINCAALNENLLESEMFGHEKGAFTGALALKHGKIEAAEGGTVFLDEIGEMAPGIQGKLLRVLQEREFERVGGLRTIRADIRVIAATNRELPEAIKVGTFRQDLYYRLNVIAVDMPPLRERRDDIPALANRFAARFAARAGRKLSGISSAARAALVQYDWPGNVRELENAIERAVVMGSTEMIVPEDLPEAVVDAGAPVEPGGYHDLVKDAKRKILMAAIERAHGVQGDAARSLGVNPTYLSRLLRNLM